MVNVIVDFQFVNARFQIDEFEGDQIVRNCKEMKDSHKKGEEKAK